MSNIPETQQPAFPQLNISFAPQGMTVTIMLGPTTAINQLIAAHDMDNIVKMWRDARKQEMDIMRVIQDTRNV